MVIDNGIYRFSYFLQRIIAQLLVSAVSVIIYVNGYVERTALRSCQKRRKNEEPPSALVQYYWERAGQGWGCT
ncbi:hypothetical protein BYT27DRAFT_6500942 [Phlegmacium glaucopus]|nr:hypothetical protein BYT27DRAFT_6500942 [Phlegmacium glaucopus]